METSKFIVLEIQTNVDGTVGNVVTAYDDRNQAESAYHSILASAAVSQLPVHAAVILTNGGYAYEHHCYEHEVQPVAPETGEGE